MSEHYRERVIELTDDDGKVTEVYLTDGDQATLATITVGTTRDYPTVTIYPGYAWQPNELRNLAKACEKAAEAWERQHKENR